MTYMSSKQVPTKITNEVLFCAIDLTNRLRAAETLGGTPTITASSSGLTVSSVAISTAAMTILGSSVSANQCVTFLASSGTAGELYTLTMTSTTSNGQTLVERFQMRVVE